MRIRLSRVTIEGGIKDESTFELESKREVYMSNITNMIAEGKGKVQVLPTREKWYGVTYHDDMPNVKASIAKKKADGLYPDALWEE